MNIMKKSIVILMIFTFLISINIISKAENEIEENIPDINGDIDNNDDINASLDDILSNNGIPSEFNSVIEKSDSDGNYFNISKNSITLDQEFSGDVFIMCADKVTIDSYVSGNVFICANEVEITKNAEITSSMFCIAKDMKINGGIDLNAYCIAGNFNLGDNSYISKNLYLSAQNISLDGLIETNAMISGDSIEFKENCIIQGNLNYSAPKEIEIPENTVGGIVSFSNNTINVNIQDVAKQRVKQIVFNIISYVVFGIIVFLILNALKSKLITNVSGFKSNIGKYILFGILGLIITPILNVILFFIPFVSRFAFVVLGIYILVLILASITTIITLSKICADKFKDKIKINDIIRTIIFITLFCIAYKLLKLIPIFGALLTFITVIFGIGITIKNILPTKEQNQ